MKRHRKWIVGSGVVLLLFLGAPAGADAPQGRYTISAGTVYDTKTKLTWQQAASAAAQPWAEAKAYCTGGWRLPTVKELQTLVDDSRADGPPIDLTAFPSTPPNLFWSSTPSLQVGNAWVVGFVTGYGYTAYLGTSSPEYVRCVR